MIHNTFHKRTARRFLAGVAAGAVLAGTGIAYAGHADPQRASLLARATPCCSA